MTDLMIPSTFGAVSKKFAATPVVDDLSSGIQSSFGMIGYKGKVWSIRHRGEEKALMRDDGDGPRGSIEVVILKASQSVSKIYYKAGYVEGSSAPPDCFSNNGLTPELASTDKQCDTCALCPHNQWGSRMTPAGKSGKACQDSKRLAVAPLGDLKNEAYGGPMLLRVPAASLQDLASYGQKMQHVGYPYYSVGTKIAFDPAEAYPKFIFSALRPLTDEEADIVLIERDSHTTNRILSESEFTVPANAQTPASNEPIFEQAPDVGAKPKEDVVAEQAKANEEAAKAKAKAEAVAKAKAAKAAAEKAAAEAAALEAAASAPLAPVEPVTSEGIDGETDEERELREQEEEMRRKREAIQAKKAAEKAAATAAASAPTPTPEVEAAPEGAGTSFESDLDAMLADLLPS